MKSPEFETSKRPMTVIHKTLMRLHEALADQADTDVKALEAAGAADVVALESARAVAAKERKEAAEYSEYVTMREGSPDYVITVRRIGASDDGKTFDPSLGGQLAALERTAVFEARLRAKQWLEERKINIEPDTEAKPGVAAKEGTITQRMKDDRKWVAESYAVLKEKFLAGIVGGEAELRRIFNLGCAVGGNETGSAFLRQAIAEVNDFNSVSPEKKKRLRWALYRGAEYECKNCEANPMTWETFGKCGTQKVNGLLPVLSGPPAEMCPTAAMLRDPEVQQMMDMVPSAFGPGSLSSFPRHQLPSHLRDLCAEADEWLAAYREGVSRG